MPTLEVVCPAGAAEGTTISVALAGGGSFEVAVPAGVGEGMPFTVEYQDPTAFVEQLAMPEEQATGLRSVLQALLDDARSKGNPGRYSKALEGEVQGSLSDGARKFSRS